MESKALPAGFRFYFRMPHETGAYVSDVCSVNLEIYGTSNLTYNFGAASALVTAANSAATAVEQQMGSRASYVSTASRDFKGYFSELFATNASTAAGDSSELVTRLRDIATFMGQLNEAAHQENARRKRAREWKQRVESRRENFIDRTWDQIFGEEPPPREGSPTPPVFNASSVSQTSREHPAAGSGAGGTSSARPEDLRSFATGSAGLNSTLEAHPGRLTNAASEFMSSCDFGGIDISPVVAGFRQFQTANTADVTWVNTIAASFEAAGSGGGVTTVSNSSLAAALASAGMSAQRQDLTIAPPQAFGGMPTTGFSNDPVNTSTGNFLEPELDLVFRGGAASLQLNRMYNSLNPAAGVFGTGWSSILDTELVIDDEGATFVLPDGRQVTFPRQGDHWARSVGENYWLTQESATDFPELTTTLSDLLVVRNNQGSWWAFTSHGTWLGTATGPGTAILIAHGPDGLITSLAHENGRFLNIEYTNGLVASARGSDGQWVTYTYDQSSQLVGMETELGKRTYRWNNEGLIDQVVGADGVLECENTYDSSSRVIEQLTQFGRTVRFAYLPGRVTAVSDHDGTNANTWIADSKGRLTGVIDSSNQRQSMSYDGHGNLVSATERDKSVTVNGYDQRGRKTRTVTPLGGDINYEYDKQDRVTTVVAANGGVISYGYDTETGRNPAVITDGEGGRTELTWHKNLLVEVIDPEGVQVSMTYNEYGDLVAITNAAGNAAKFVRNQSGHITAAISPSGLRTTYTHDRAGLVVSRKDPDGAMWKFEYGPGAKLVAVIDPYGAKITMEYGFHGELVKTTDALGREVFREFDVMGNAKSITLPDGAQWLYEHDALSRLKQMVDPAGNTWNYGYDVAGGLHTAVDPTGVRVETDQGATDGTQTLRTAFEETSIEFDSYGRPVRTQRPDSSADLISYDRCGRPVELLDADGGLTKITRDLAGRVIKVVTAEGMTSQYEYDACGRPSTATDPSGARSTLTYDADSRVVARTLATGEATKTEYDRAGRVCLRHIPGRGTARYTHDLAGRLTFVQDQQFGQRRFQYDLAGQLVTVTNGLGGVTRYSYDSRGRVGSIEDPAGGVTTYSYTPMDLVETVTDPLGRVTSSDYDGAGRRTSHTDPDNNTIGWEYDRAGLEKIVRVNGQVISKIDRNARQRSATMADYSGKYAVTHDLTFNRLGQLIAKTVGPGTTTWAYDRDGRRTSMTTPDGEKTTYTRDMVGRVTRISHSTLGDVDLSYDLSGRILSSHAGGLTQKWQYEDGFPVVHTTTNAQQTETTIIDRDSEGRISKISGPAGTVKYGYDGASQLVYSTVEGGPSRVWRYDPAGRLTAESVDGQDRTFTYDVAGQLLSATERNLAGQDSLNIYSYDGAGRRVQFSSPDTEVTYGWDGLGRLIQVTESTVDSTSTHTLHVDVSGELTRINDTEVLWDSASAIPTVSCVGGASVLVTPGGVLGSKFGAIVGDEPQWSAAGWRTARATEPQDPWATLTSLSADSNASEIGLTPTGSLQVAGLEWLGARAYDPGARGFLSADPMQSAIGAGWAANHYSYAGNNPLGALDPLGLSPVTDAELDAYAHANQGALANANDWVGENWEYLVGGAMVVGGGILMATGVGGPVGMMLIGAGADTIIQKATTGEVNWGQVALSGAVGGFGGASVAARAGLTGMKAAVVSGASSGGLSGTVMNSYAYLTGPGPVTLLGTVEAAGQGMAFGALTGGAGGAAGQRVSQSINVRLTTNPTAQTLAMGRSMDYRVIPYAQSNNYGYYNALPPSVFDTGERYLGKELNENVNVWVNRKWANYQTMQGRNLVDIGAPDPLLRPPGVPELGPSPYYNAELDQIAGYPLYSQDIQPSWDLKGLVK